MKTRKYRHVLIYKNFFERFYIKQSKKVQNKISWTLKLIEEIQIIPDVYLKHIENTDALYEIRVQSGGDILEFLAFLMMAT